MDTTKHINTLIKKRDQLRKNKQFDAADTLRKQIEALGYQLIDLPDGTQSVDKNNTQSTPQKQFLVVFGSGETSSIGRTIYEDVFSQIGVCTMHIAVVTTPAGFQPNVDTVHEEIRHFFITGLKNYHPQVTIVNAHTKCQANATAIRESILRAHVIFLGPGSPTYAVKHLQKTHTLAAIHEAMRLGKSLILSSAAALAFSKYTLPVYEIYKAGMDEYWMDGLDLYSDYTQHLHSVLPHLNNSDGGHKNDTSFCYMGEKRFKRLRSLLPIDVRITGIDEQTAYVINLKSQTTHVLGKGTIRQI